MSEMAVPPVYRFDGRCILVTGAGRGIAAAAAEALAVRGARIGVCDRIADRARNTTRRIIDAGGDAIPLPADVGSEIEVMQVVRELTGRFGGIDVLINGAGSYGKGFRCTHETPVEEWDAVFASNVRGTFLCAKAVLPGMVARGSGRIVNISSNAGRSVSPLLGCSYTSAKAAVIGISRHLSREYARRGILVNTLCPGPVDGERVSDLLDASYGREQLMSDIPLGRLATNEDIVAAILFLSSDACGFMTGAVLDVSGGLVLA